MDKVEPSQPATKFKKLKTGANECDVRKHSPAHESSTLDLEVKQRKKPPSHRVCTEYSYARPSEVRTCKVKVE